MSDETTAAEAVEQEVAPVETVEETAIETADGSEEGEETNELEDLLKQATGADAVTPDAVEVEYEGKKYQIPPELKDALLRQSDYTKKTMSLADERKAIEATKTKVEEIFSATEEAVEASFGAKAAQARVDSLLATPIEGLSEDQITSLRLDLADARTAVSHYQGKAAELAQKATTERSQHFAKAVTEARTEAAKHIPNFDDAKITALGSLVESLGGDPETVKNLDHPAAYRVLHLAHIGQQFIERQRQAGKAKAAQDVQPATEVGTKSTPPRGLSDNLSAEEWTKRRNEQLKKRS